MARALVKIVPAVAQWPPFVRLFHRTAKKLFGLHIHGRELLPAGRPVILVANHGSHYDGLFLRVVGRELLGEPVVSVAWGGVRHFPFGRPALEGNAFPLILTEETRNTPGTRAGVLDQIIEHLRAGRNIAINAEGDRYDALAPFQPGAAFAALETGAPIVPITLLGVQTLWRDLPWPKRWWGHVTAQLHGPVTPGAFADLPRREAVRAMTDETRRRIASVLDYPDSLGAR